MLSKNNKKLIREIRLKLKPLYKEQKIINSKITLLNNSINNIIENNDKEFSKTIPLELDKISAEQWKWILEAGHFETKTQYGFHSKIIKSFYRNGFYEETNQIAFSLSGYNTTEDKILEEFKYLKKYLKPIDLGIKIQVTGIDEDHSSIIYIHEDDSVSLCKNIYNKKDIYEKFNNFETFLKWYFKTIDNIMNNFTKDKDLYKDEDEYKDEDLYNEDEDEYQY
jgi:uncharacterized protein Usg